MANRAGGVNHRFQAAHHSSCTQRSLQSLRGQHIKKIVQRDGCAARMCVYFTCLETTRITRAFAPSGSLGLSLIAGRCAAESERQTAASEALVESCLVAHLHTASYPTRHPCLVRPVVRQVGSGFRRAPADPQRCSAALECAGANAKGARPNRRAAELSVWADSLEHS